MAIFSRKQCSSKKTHYAYIFCRFPKEIFCPLGASLRSAWESVRFASERSRVRIPLGPPICRIVLYDAAFFMPIDFLHISILMGNVKPPAEKSSTGGLKNTVFLLFVLDTPEVGTFRRRICTAPLASQPPRLLSDRAANYGSIIIGVPDDGTIQFSRCVRSDASCSGFRHLVNRPLTW